MAHRQNPVTQSTQFRVYRVSRTLREQIRKAREQRKLTIREFVATAIEAELPKIVKGLSEVGIEPMGAETKPARLVMTDEGLAMLKAACEAVGVPATMLLAGCLRLSARRKRQGRTPKKAD